MIAIHHILNRKFSYVGKFVQHQLFQVANFWKLGRNAEFHLQAGAGGLAELKLTFQLPSPCEPS